MAKDPNNNPEMEVDDIVQGSDESGGIGSTIAVIVFAVLVAYLLYRFFPWQFLIGAVAIVALFILTAILNSKIARKADDGYLISADPDLFSRVAVIDSVASLLRLLGLSFGILFLLAGLLGTDAGIFLTLAIVCFALYVISFVQIPLRASARALVPKDNA